MPGELDEDVQVDDLNIDEASASDTADVFPDPDLGVEAEVLPPGEPEASADEPSAVLPAPEAPPPLPIPQYIPPPPPSDGGFTPYIPPRAEPPQSEVKFFSMEQLRQGVNDGIITEDQMVTQLQLQTKEQAKQEALQAFQQQSQAQTVTHQLNEYRTLVPGWDQTGSPANQQATPAFLRLLQMGLSDNDTTRLLALEQTFGPVNRMKEARATKTRTATLRETTQDVGRRGAPPSSRAKKDPLDTLSLDSKRLYKSYIEKGIYKDWNAVRAEVKDEGARSVNPGLRVKG